MSNHYKKLREQKLKDGPAKPEQRMSSDVHSASLRAMSPGLGMKMQHRPQAQVTAAEVEHQAADESQGFSKQSSI